MRLGGAAVNGDAAPSESTPFEVNLRPCHLVTLDTMIRRSEAFAASLIVLALTIAVAFLVFGEGSRDSSDVAEPTLSQTATEVPNFTPAPVAAEAVSPPEEDGSAGSTSAPSQADDNPRVSPAEEK